MPDANIDLVNRMIEEIQNKKRIEVVDELFARDFVNHTPVRGIANDRDGMRHLFAMTHVAFPNGVVTVQDQAARDGRVWTRKTFVGTHTGPFRGIAATGKKVSYDVFDILEIRSEKIIGHWGLADQLSLLRQVGAVKL